MNVNKTTNTYPKTCIRCGKVGFVLNNGYCVRCDNVIYGNSVCGKKENAGE